MYNTEIMDKILIHSPAKFIPGAPLGIWYDTNRGLEDFYNKNNIKDKEIKNKMRHVTGLARTTQAYGAPTARMLGLVKETADFWSGNQDNAKDFKNNDLGINYALKHPKATREEIMNYAFRRALLDKDPLKNFAEYLAE